MKFSNIFAILTAATLVLLPSCLSTEEEVTNDYAAWRLLNERYVDSIENVTKDGSLVYEKIVPEWDKSIFVLVDWINDRTENSNLLTPLSNSTVTVKYTLTNIQGDTLDQNSSYVLQPNNMVTGFWTAVTNMHVHDTVNVVIPYNAGYGLYGNGNILPFTTLNFGIRLDSINKLY